ncbi:MAG TPA: patatin family protein [Candidatus Thermoplasmatota archaeon]|nr:patatin family protein [Candidatus Thermoplasmatota archaeon]
MRALVIEGGGMRAAYASGAVHGLAEADLQVDAVYGTSAGGAIAAWFGAGQAHESPRTWAWAADRTLMSYRRWLTGRGPLWDLQRLYQTFYLERIRLKVEALASARFPVRVSVTDADTGEALYPDLRQGPVHDLLMATSALPLAVAKPVEALGRRLLDGGVADPIPVARAIADGYTDLVVVLNRPKGPPRKPEPWWVSRLAAREYPAIAHLSARHHDLHNAAVALAENPPPGVRITLVRPTRPTGLSRLTRDPRLLDRAIRQGFEDGQAALARGPGVRQRL